MELSHFSCRYFIKGWQKVQLTFQRSFIWPQLQGAIQYTFLFSTALGMYYGMASTDVDATWAEGSWDQLSKYGMLLLISLQTLFAALVNSTLFFPGFAEATKLFPSSGFGSHCLYQWRTFDCLWCEKKLSTRPTQTKLSSFANCLTDTIFFKSHH